MVALTLIARWLWSTSPVLVCHMSPRPSRARRRPSLFALASARPSDSSPRLIACGECYYADAKPRTPTLLQLARPLPRPPSHFNPLLSFFSRKSPRSLPAFFLYSPTHSLPALVAVQGCLALVRQTSSSIALFTGHTLQLKAPFTCFRRLGHCSSRQNDSSSTFVVPHFAVCHQRTS